MKEYIMPKFDVTVYDIDDEITLNESYTGDIEIGKDDPDGDEGWFG